MWTVDYGRQRERQTTGKKESQDQIDKKDITKERKKRREEEGGGGEKLKIEFRARDQG